MRSPPTNPTIGQPERRPELTRDIERVLAVVAHPDDESFALGAVLDRLIACGIPVTLLCFTHGEASTLRARAGDLATVRGTELRTAAAVLGVESVELLDYPDGRLDRHPLDELAGHVRRLIAAQHPSHLLVFDTGGVTGHPDHQQATRAALTAARATGRTVLAWTIPQDVADRLNGQFGTDFRGRPPDQIDARLSVSRTRQRRAITAHRSQPDPRSVQPAARPPGPGHRPGDRTAAALQRRRPRRRTQRHPRPGIGPADHGPGHRLPRTQSGRRQRRHPAARRPRPAHRLSAGWPARARLPSTAPRLWA
jgi:LmbE family N-acetylglucosaminyl deacetylase